MAGMFAAGMLMAPAGVPVTCFMVIAGGDGVGGQTSCQIIGNGTVGIPRGSGAEGDSGLGKCIDRSGANSTADQDIHIPMGKKSRQRTVSLSKGGNHFGSPDISVVYRIDFELPGMPEVSEY